MLLSKACVLLVVCALAQADACCSCTCTCGLGPEVDMCACPNSKCCEPIIVRPQEVPKPLTAVSLTPLPGLCGCKRAIVKPATLPRPVCKPTCQTTVTTSCCCNNQQCQNTNSATTCIGGTSFILDNAGSAYNSQSGVVAPADAVSIAIAQKNTQQYCNVNEDKLTYGFRKLPIDVPVKKTVKQNNIPEERIFNLNGQIVEYKPVGQTCSVANLEEEAADDLLAVQADESFACGNSEVKGISLGELGYVPAQISEKTFVDVPYRKVDVGAATSATCDVAASGFKAGNVVYKTIPKREPITIEVAEDTEDCESNEAGEGQSIVYEPVTITCGCGTANCGCGGQSVYQSSSSSSSNSRNTKKASLFIQKLCN